MKKAKIFIKRPEPKEGESFEEVNFLMEKQSRELEEYCYSKSLCFDTSCLGVRQVDYHLPFMDQIKPILKYFEDQDEYNVLLVYSEDQLSKNKREVEEFEKELAKRGVRLVTLHKSRNLTPEHEELMKKSLPEIATIYKAIHQEVGFTGKKSKTKRWQEAALSKFNQSPQEFTFIKRKYLERDPLYKNLQGKQKARTFFGKILQYVFQDNGLPKVNKEKIIEKIRETNTWKEFRGY
jgi:DNA invertase Pin-like site-specific DNA recombinase